MTKLLRKNTIKPFLDISILIFYAELYLDPDILNFGQIWILGLCYHFLQLF